MVHLFLVSIEESNLAAVGDMTPVMSVTVSKPALTYYGTRDRTRTDKPCGDRF